MQIIVGVALLIVLIQLGLSLNLWSVVLGHTLLIMPFSILIMNSAFNNLDISLEEASIDLGENQFGTFYRIILPLVFSAYSANCGLFLYWVKSVQGSDESNSKPVYGYER